MGDFDQSRVFKFCDGPQAGFCVGRRRYSREPVATVPPRAMLPRTHNAVMQRPILISRERFPHVKAKEFMRAYPANWLTANPVEGKRLSQLDRSIV